MDFFKLLGLVWLVSFGICCVPLFCFFGQRNEGQESINSSEDLLILYLIDLIFEKGFFVRKNITDSCLPVRNKMEEQYDTVKSC